MDSHPEGSDLTDIQERSYLRASKSLLESYPKTHAMNASELGEFLDRKIYAVLATTRPDGRAHATPVGFLLWRSAFWIASIEGTRARNLKNQPWASIVIIEGEPPRKHQAVIAEGPVQMHKDSEMKEILLEQEFTGRWERKLGRKPDWASVLIELRPKRLFSYDAKKEERENILT